MKNEEFSNTVVIFNLFYLFRATNKGEQIVRPACLNFNF